MDKIAKRYSLGKKFDSIFSIFTSEIIEEYQGFDNLTENNSDEILRLRHIYQELRS